MLWNVNCLQYFTDILFWNVFLRSTYLKTILSDFQYIICKRIADVWNIIFYKNSSNGHTSFGCYFFRNFKNLERFFWNSVSIPFYRHFKFFFKVNQYINSWTVLNGLSRCTIFFSQNCIFLAFLLCLDKYPNICMQLIIIVVKSL